MNMTNPILKHLDDPIRILAFSIGDLIGYLSTFFIGSLFDSLFVVPLIGIGFVYFLKRILRRFPRFYTVRFLYWSLPTKRFNQMFKLNLPISSIRIWVK